MEPTYLGAASFPLVPQRRLVGLTLGALRGSRRGRGYEVIGSRPYRPGDDMRSIDWAASARLSSARDDDLFVIRERYVEEAPHVIVLCDHRPSMALYTPPLPWLSKPRAVRHAVDLIITSALVERGFLGYLDLAEDEPLWRPPRTQRVLPEFHDERPYTAPADALTRGLDYLRVHRRGVPLGTFVFVLSDFLDPPGEEAWIEVLEHGWDVVPVVIQDATWEQSFPDVAGVVVPLQDPRDGSIRSVRLSAREVDARRREHEERLEQLLTRLRTLAVEPVVLPSDNPDDILDAFLGWADIRTTARVAP